MKKKRIIAMLTTIMMSVSIISGCGGNGDTQENAAQQEAENTDETVKNLAETELDKSEIQIELVTGDGVTLPDEKDNFVEQGLKEALGFDVKLNILGAGADYATALNARISGGDIPDMFVVPSMDSIYQYAKNGIILGLNDYSSQLQPLMEWAGEDTIIANSYEGELYMIPQKTTINYDTWMIRQDWLDKVGAKMPTTMEELLEVAKKFTYEDPDGNGQNDTYGFSSSGLGAGFGGILNSYGASAANNIILVDGEITSTLLQPHMVEGLEMCKKFVDAGVVDPDIVANDDNTIKDKMIQGKVGICPYAWSGVYKKITMEKIKEVNPEANWVWFNPPESGTGDPAAYSTRSMCKAGKWCINAKLAEQPDKLKAVFELLNYLTTEEGQRLVCYGIEGRHYNMVDGKVVKTELMDKECDFLWPYQIPLRDDREYLAVKFLEAKEVIDFAANMNEIEIYDAGVTLPEGFHKEDMDKYIQDNMISFIFGQRPLEEYDQFLEELNKSFSFDEYMDEARRQLQEKGYIK